MRNIQCGKYEQCLQKAALRDLPGLGCETCPRRDERTVPAGSVDDFPGCMALVEAVFCRKVTSPGDLALLEKAGGLNLGALRALEDAQAKSALAFARREKRRQAG